MLSALGLSSTEEAVYLALLAEPGLSPDDLARRIGITTVQSVQTLERLNALDLVSPVEFDLGTWIGVAPAIALVPLLARAGAELDQHRQRLDEARLATVQLTAEYPMLDVRAPRGQFRPLYGVEEISAFLAEQARLVRRESLTMLPGIARAHDRRRDQEM